MLCILYYYGLLLLKINDHSFMYFLQLQMASNSCPKSLDEIRGSDECVYYSYVHTLYNFISITYTCVCVCVCVIKAWFNILKIIIHTFHQHLIAMPTVDACSDG